MVQSVEEATHNSQMRQYWRRHALPTCAALLVVVALSAFAHPLTGMFVMGALAGGVLAFLGSSASERSQGLLALSLYCAGLLVLVWSMAAHACGCKALACLARLFALA
jgi:lipopolysaccharide export LptBFGC system permease protein LptF